MLGIAASKTAIMPSTSSAKELVVEVFGGTPSCQTGSAFVGVGAKEEGVSFSRRR